MRVSKLLSEGVPQKEVAKHLDVATTTITRWKKEALACRMLRITYHPPQLPELELALQKKLAPYGVRDVLVCRKDVGVTAARYYAASAKNDHTLVVDGGVTVSDFVTALASVNLPPLRVIPICADPPSYRVSAYECMTRLATLFPGTVRCEKLPHLTSPELAKDHRRIQRLAAKAEVVVLGCGRKTFARSIPACSASAAIAHWTPKGGTYGCATSSV
jgi:DNA-binding transcriptional regulator LsrR (DeoR family)